MVSPSAGVFPIKVGASVGGSGVIVAAATGLGESGGQRRLAGGTAACRRGHLDAALWAKHAQRGPGAAGFVCVLGTLCP